MKLTRTLPVTKLPRFLFVERGQFVGGKDDPARLLLIECSDGTWRKPTGQELMALHEAHPTFFYSVAVVDEDQS